MTVLFAIIMAFSCVLSLYLWRIARTVITGQGERRFAYIMSGVFFVDALLLSFMIYYQINQLQ